MASVFSMILQQKIPGHFVWQDDRAFAIMTIQPLRPGHLLVIPRQEIDHWDDLEPDLAAHLMQVAQRLAKALKQTFPAKRVGLVIAGLEVPHTHIHVFPVDALTDFDFSLARAAEPEQLANAAAAIRQTLECQGVAHGCSA